MNTLNINRIFKPTLVALAISCVFNVAHAADEAKDKPQKEDDIEVIEVTGIRAGLENALNKKRFSDQVMDSISAEDIGKFPDDNIAEALQRIAGISIGRDDAGAGDTISIRGMGPDMNKVTLNGQGLASAGGITESGSGFSFGMLSSDMISALEVYKSPLAAQDGGSVGGSVNIRTKGPLEVKKTKMQLGLEAGYQELGNGQTHKVSGRLMTQFLDNTLGLSVGFNSSKSPSRSDESGANSYRNPKLTNPNKTDEYFNRDGSLRVNSANQEVDAQGDVLLDEDGKALGLRNIFGMNAYRIVQKTANREKQGADFTLQWRPADDVNFSVNGLIATQVDDDHQESFMMNFGAGGRDTRTGVVDDFGFITQQTVTPKNANQRDVSQQQWVRNHEKSISSLSASLDWFITDQLTITVQAGKSIGTRWQETELHSFATAAVISYDMDNAADPRFPILSIDGIAMNGINGVGFEAFIPSNDMFDFTGLNHQIQQWESDTDFAQIDFDYDTGFDFFHTLKFGAKLKNDNQSQNKKQGKVSDTGNMGTMEDYFGYTIGESSYHQARWSVADTDKIEERWGLWRDVPFGGDNQIKTGVFKRGNFGSPISDWDVNLEIKAAYVQTDFEGEFLLPIRGNVGVRYEETNMINLSKFQDPNSTDLVYLDFVATNSYSDVLPSLNLSASLSDDVILRFSAAKVMARPKASDLTAAPKLNLGAEEGQINTAKAGNPDLKPFRATQFDLGLEWYFNQGSLLSAGLFMKDVDTFIARSVEDRDYNGQTYETAVPVNGEGAKIKGIELTYEQPFTFLPGFLANTGTQINYTYTDSSTEEFDAVFGVSLPLVGLSKNTMNATLYYEQHGVSVRIAYTYRDEYLKSTGGTGIPLSIKPQGFLDAKIGYKLNKNISFSLKLNNITDQEREHYVIDQDITRGTITSGRTATIGMAIKM